MYCRGVFWKVSFLLFVFLLFSSDLLLPCTASAQPFGPGNAGQVHALAFDPDDPDVIYAGGDCGGAFVSRDYGLTWTSINEGLENSDFVGNGYVDGLFVLREGDSDYQGVYAATHGGLYFRADTDTCWTLLTDYLSCPDDYLYKAYRHSSVTPMPIPFNCLAYDSANQVMYAGAGHGRLADGTGIYRPYYPEHGTNWTEFYPDEEDLPCSEDESGYSLWYCPLIEGDNCSWQPVEATYDLGMVRQIDTLTMQNKTMVVFACTKGIYLFDPAKGACFDLWQTTEIKIKGRPKPLDTDRWVANGWGVGVGGDGVLYCLARTDAYGSPETPPDLLREGFACFQIDLGSPEAEWSYLGGMDANIYPHDDVTMNSLTTDLDNALIHLTVVPGIGTQPDEVFVGNRFNTPRSGYYRFGKYAFWNEDTEQREEITGWMQILYLQRANEDLVSTWNNSIVSALKWWEDPVEKQVISPVGWLVNHGLFSTTPLIVHPSDPTHMFAMCYHIPVRADYNPYNYDEWEWVQSYCTSSNFDPTGWDGTSWPPPDVDADWAGNGLSLSGFDDMAIDSEGRRFFVINDYTGFIETTPQSGEFRWVDSYDPVFGASAVKILAHDGVEDFLVLRESKLHYISEDSLRVFFEFENDGKYIYQQHTIARYDPSSTSYDYETGDGFGWQFYSRGIDLVMAEAGLDSTNYDIWDFEVFDHETLFAACEALENGFWKSWVMRGKKSAEGEWIWTDWWNIGGSAIGKHARVKKLLILPGTEKLIAIVEGYYCSGVYCLTDFDASSAHCENWLVREDLNSDGPDYDDKESHYKYGLYYPRSLAASKDGETLYVGTRGQIYHFVDVDSTCEFSSSPPYMGTIFRLDVTDTVPSWDDWDMLVNPHIVDEYDSLVVDNTFGFDKPSWWDDLDYEITAPERFPHRLTTISSIAVDPQNPHKIYVGQNSSNPNIMHVFYPRNGAWCYTPDSLEGGTWDQIFGVEGSLLDIPSQGVKKVVIDPNDPTKLYLDQGGIIGYELSIELPPQFELADSAEYPICRGDSVYTVLAISEIDGSPLSYMAVDATTIGGTDKVELNDSGEDGDYEAGDNIWSGTLVNVTTDSLGVYTLPITARDSSWNTTYGDLEVTVVDGPQITEVNGQFEYATNHELLNLIFRWQTNLLTWEDLDCVTLDVDAMDPQCLPEFTVITKDLGSSVLLDITPILGGYEHKLILLNQPCVTNCTVIFQVESGLGDVISGSILPESFINRLDCSGTP